MAKQSKNPRKEKYEKPVLESIKKEDLKFEALLDEWDQGDFDKSNSGRDCN